MSDATPPAPTDSAAGTYDVVLLVEQPFSAVDARNVLSLHEGLEEPVRYHVLLPAEDAASRVEGAIGSLGTGDSLGVQAFGPGEADVASLQQELLAESRAGLARTIEELERAGGVATGDVVTSEPVRALVSRAEAVGAAEVIILTRPHVVSELFHVDWTSRARRKLGVPVLHLLEHENFDEQAGEGEGISGF